MPTDPYADIASPVSQAQADPYADIASPVSAPKPEDWQATPYGFKVKSGEAPTGGPATIREDGAINQPGEQGWKFFDPKTGVYAPAPSEPWANKGILSAALGVDTLAHYGRNLKAGWDSAMSGLYDAGSRIATATGVQAPESRMEAIRRINAGLRQTQALKNTGGSTATTAQFAGEAAPVVAASAVLSPQVAAFLPSSTASIAAPTALGLSTAAMTPGTPQERAQAGELAATVAPLAEAGVKAIPEVGKAIGGGLRKLITGKYAPAAKQIIEDELTQGVNPRPSTVINAAKVATPAEEVAAARASAGNLTDNLASNTQNTPYRGLERVTRAALNGDAEAQGILERINRPDASPSQIAQDSGAVQAKRAQLIKNELWNKVDEIAGPKGVELPQTYDAIQELRAQVAKKGDIPGLSSELDRLERYFPQRDPNTGKMLAPLNPDKSFGNLKMDAIQRLNDILGGVADNADSKALQRAAGTLKDALQGDMHNFAAKSGNNKLWNAYNRANTFHREVFAPTLESQPINFQNAFATDQAGNPAFADQLIAKLGQKSNGADRAGAIGTALGPKGRAAFAQALVENSISKGEVSRTGTWVPGGAAADLASRMNTINELLPKGPERVQVQGVLNMLQHLAKASPENASALGERFAQVAGAGEGITGSIAKAYKFIKDGGIDLLFNSDKGKNYLFQLSQAKPGSEAADSIIRKAVRLGATPLPSNIQPLRPALPAAADTGTADQQASK